MTHARTLTAHTARAQRTHRFARLAYAAVTPSLYDRAIPLDLLRAVELSTVKDVRS